ncbi:transcriptional regulator with XRE-family HTH domain [Fontibacillus solani]|uniref:Transcriptional regulator with XRE-family HTH domain n=1 Tax=Fontibacillus solani TaxID=1572857 RepID=A0A7W3SV51_9BACL|nr:transcriptional regulator [Fontibacillus solani]MBA9086543.1 transcriptional regulator with XRE-family HTH domain [Fontibacillus solani]
MTTFYNSDEKLSVPSWNEIKPGVLLKTCRLRAGLTQEQLAEKMHRSRSCISKIENDKTQVNIVTFFTWIENTNAFDVLYETILRNQYGVVLQMNVTITKIEMPTNEDWGIVQINNLNNTYFRFDFLDGKPVLDKNFFADAVQNSNEKQRILGSDLYQAIQTALEFYFINRKGVD